MTHVFNPVTGMLMISVPGNLLSTNASQFLASAMSLIEAQPRLDVAWQGAQFDLTRAQMVDSAGLNALICLIRKLKIDGKRAVIHVQDAHVHRIFVFTRLDRQAEIVRV